MDKTFGFTRLLMHISRKGGSRNFEKVDERGRGIAKLLWNKSLMFKKRNLANNRERMSRI